MQLPSRIPLPDSRLFSVINLQATCRGRSVLLVLLWSIFSILPPQWAIAQGSEPKKEMPFRFNIRIKWHKDWGRTDDMGHLNASVRGKLKLKEEIDEQLIYSFSNTFTGYNYLFRTKMKELSDQCYDRVTLREKGAGSAIPTIAFQALRGKLGRAHFLQYKMVQSGNLDIGSLVGFAMNPAKEKPLDTYTFLLISGKLPTMKHYLCPGKQRMEPSLNGFAINHLCGVLTPRTNFAHYNWSTSAHWTNGTTPTETLKTGDCQGIKIMLPGRAKSPNTSYQFNWQFGDVEPMIEIWYHYIDITDEKEDIIIGRKVILEAKVFPAGHQMNEIKWKIDGYTPGSGNAVAVAGYKATRYSAKVTPISNQDLEGKRRITFYWVKGSPTGKAYRITCTAKIDGKKEKAQTTFRVFTPQFDKGNCLRHITKYISKGSYPGSSFQNVYLGKITSIASSHTIGPGSETGIELKHEIIMPPLEDESNLLQYYQIFREIKLEYNGVKYWRESNEKNKWSFDYDPKDILYFVNYRNEAPGPKSREMNDTPGNELCNVGQLKKQVYLCTLFKTYLMFKPSSDPKDAETIWVPLECVHWGWAVGVHDNPKNPRNVPCNKRSFLFDFKKVWPKRLKPIFLPSYPEWRNDRDNHELTKKEWLNSIKHIKSIMRQH